VNALRDARGCLTPAGLSAVRSAPPGRAEPELASHLASCARCQEQLLAGDLAEKGPRKKKQPPPLWRFGVVLLLTLLVIISVMVTLGRIAGH